MCWRGELNPHAVYTARDFESRASASSATPADKTARLTERLSLTFLHFSRNWSRKHVTMSFAKCVAEDRLWLRFSCGHKRLPS